MSGRTHAQRIIALLSERSGLDDDETASALTLDPRQTVNQRCSQLAASGLLRRGRGPSGKIVNSIGQASIAIVHVTPRTPPAMPESKVVERRSDRSFIPA